VLEIATQTAVHDGSEWGRALDGDQACAVEANSNAWLEDRGRLQWDCNNLAAANWGAQAFSKASNGNANSATRSLRHDLPSASLSHRLSLLGHETNIVEAPGKGSPWYLLYRLCSRQNHFDALLRMHRRGQHSALALV
jgi:hypothetical protein